jgi:RNA polymerase sigma-70 factor (ECF subfamily)
VVRARWRDVTPGRKAAPTPGNRCILDAVTVDVEAEVRRRCDAGDVRGAVTAAIEGYGPELLGFLVVVVGDPTEGGDVFADTCVRIWKSLPGFRWESSLRTWVYVLARRACQAHRKERAKQRERQVPLSDVPEIDEMIRRVRTTTAARLSHQEGTTRAERLRAKLDLDEQMLLTLRIDRELEWRAVASIMSDEPLDEPALVREAASLRKRFERVKAKLKELAALDPP